MGSLFLARRVAPKSLTHSQWSGCEWRCQCGWAVEEHGDKFTCWGRVLAEIVGLVELGGCDGQDDGTGGTDAGLS